MLHPAMVSSITELEQILQMQQIYLRGKNSQAEEKDQGFLTVCHSMESLQQMHAREPSIIVKNEDQLAGYALVMPATCRNLIPVLVPMFEHFDKVIYRGSEVSKYNYYVMGQICVAKEFRGGGVFDMLYAKHKKEFMDKYDFVITEVSLSNTRSLRAHERVGFQNVYEHTDATDDWVVMLWDFR
jgi:ribosomal protein S18 acetylase RimI-like enzyme